MIDFVRFYSSIRLQKGLTNPEMLIKAKILGRLFLPHTNSGT